MVTIAHISDIHFGAVDLDAAETLADAVEALGVDAVVVTGDLTQAGRRREFEDAAAYLKQFSAPSLVVPGNHDAPVYSVGERMVDPWRRFRKYINEDLNPALAIDGAMIVGLKSARRANPSLDWSRGRLSRDQINSASEKLRGADKHVLKLVAFHHPVLRSTGVAGGAIINNPDRAISAFASAGADLVMTGHVHIANATVHRAAETPLIIASAGTASSTRTRGEAPSFNLVKGSANEFEVQIWRYSAAGYVIDREHSFERKSGRWMDSDNQ